MRDIGYINKISSDIDGKIDLPSDEIAGESNGDATPRQQTPTNATSTGKTTPDINISAPVSVNNNIGNSAPVSGNNVGNNGPVSANNNIGNSAVSGNNNVGNSAPVSANNNNNNNESLHSLDTEKLSPSPPPPRPQSRKQSSIQAKKSSFMSQRYSQMYHVNEGSIKDSAIVRLVLIWTDW